MRDRTDQMEFLPSISVSTLIIASEDDAIIPKAAADAMHKAFPRSKLVMVPNAGHAAPVDNPEAVQRAIREFVG
jgi:pimeloyl-ACP methyl ester carboxylesterase